MKNFSVDTHLFRELGEHLVGRDSTALIELIKNSYDADATLVTVHGERLAESGQGRIVITDNGIGMTTKVFQKGFLTIASRLKEEGDRRSARFKRRFTGAKGVGRLAAHKLAHELWVISVPAADVYGSDAPPIEAGIDWDKVESVSTLDQVERTNAITLTTVPRRRNSNSGTVIELRKLRKKWTEGERVAFFNEVQTFQPPDALLRLPDRLIKDPLIKEVVVADSKRSDNGMRVQLTGELDAGEGYWSVVADTSNWVLEIDGISDGRHIVYQVSPTARVNEALGPKLKATTVKIPRPENQVMPDFHARIFVREGPLGVKDKVARQWLGRMSGIRVYMEGFRVLPYGDRTDDWLEIDYDYNRRSRSLRFLSELGAANDHDADEDAALSFLPNANYFGAVFLTNNKSGGLQMLVNREGFIPNASFANLHRLVRVGVDLLTRERASANLEARGERKSERIASAAAKVAATQATVGAIKKAIQTELDEAAELAAKAEQDARAGKMRDAASHIRAAAERIHRGHDASRSLIEEQELIRILAALGLQMSAFVHEVNSLLIVAREIESIASTIRSDPSLSRSARAASAQLMSRLSDLRRSIERQASYLSDVSSPDARRRRSRQSLRERLDVALALLAPASERLGIKIENRVSPDHRTRPMFPAEVMLMLSNLLSNAIKAAGRGGRIRVSTAATERGIAVRMENTGRKVDLSDSERWFRPFASTTANPDPYLGQGMGMGLPIVRSMIEDYGGAIGFVPPSKDFNTAIQLDFPI